MGTIEHLLVLALICISVILAAGQFLKTRNALQACVKMFHLFRRIKFRKAKVNQRREARVPFVAKGECVDLTRRAFEGAPFQAYLIDLSGSGCQIISNVHLEPTTLVSLRFREKGILHRLALVAYSQTMGKLHRNGLAFVP